MTYKYNTEKCLGLENLLQYSFKLVNKFHFKIS